MAEVIVGMGALERRLRAIAHTEIQMKMLAAAAVREQKLLVPRKTGNLGRSIHVAEVTASQARIIAGANYAAYVEFGTKPHEITPNARKALRWSTGATRLTGSPTKGAIRAGNVAFATKVHHPGTKAHPYMIPGAKAAIAKGGLTDVIVRAWNEAA